VFRDHRSDPALRRAGAELGRDVAPIRASVQREFHSGGDLAWHLGPTTPWRFLIGASHGGATWFAAEMVSSSTVNNPFSLAQEMRPF